MTTATTPDGRSTRWAEHRARAAPRARRGHAAGDPRARRRRRHGRDRRSPPARSKTVIYRHFTDRPGSTTRSPSASTTSSCATSGTRSARPGCRSPTSPSTPAPHRRRHRRLSRPGREGPGGLPVHRRRAAARPRYRRRRRPGRRVSDHIAEQLCAALRGGPRGDRARHRRRPGLGPGRGRHGPRRRRRAGSPAGPASPACRVGRSPSTSPPSRGPAWPPPGRTAGLTAPPHPRPRPTTSRPPAGGADMIRARHRPQRAAIDGRWSHLRDGAAHAGPGAASRHPGRADDGAVPRLDHRAARAARRAALRPRRRLPVAWAAPATSAHRSPPSRCSATATCRCGQGRRALRPLRRRRDEPRHRSATTRHTSTSMLDARVPGLLRHDRDRSRLQRPARSDHRDVRRRDRRARRPHPDRHGAQGLHRQRGPGRADGRRLRAARHRRGRHTACTASSSRSATRTATRCPGVTIGD